MSQPGLKLSTSKHGTKLIRGTRPGTVGGGGSKVFNRSDFVRVMRSSANQNSAHRQTLTSDLINFTDEHQHIKVSLMGRNMPNTASHENHNKHQALAIKG